MTRMTDAGTPETTAAAAQQTAVLLAAFEAMAGTLSVAEALPAIRVRLEGLLRAVDRLQASLPRP